MTTVTTSTPNSKRSPNGSPTGREGMRRYQCSTRRHHGDCEQTMTPAQPLEEQLIDWLHDFQPDPELRRLILDTIQAETGGHPGEDAERRRELTGQLERLRELYLMGDITKPQYVMRRQIIEEELQRTKPPTNPDLDRAQAILEDFAHFWDAEPNPAERRKLLLFAVRPGMGQGQPNRGRQAQRGVRRLLHRRVGGAGHAPKSRRGR
jgi:hypothetical protein